MTGTAPIAAPYGVDGRGRTAEATLDVHVRSLIEMLLFTIPGERVMRPTFGTGILSLVFDPNGPQIAATTQMLVAGALQQWLGDLITVNDVTVTAADATLSITVTYTDKLSGQSTTTTFERPT